MRVSELVKSIGRGPSDRADSVREGLSYARHSPECGCVLMMTMVVSTVGFNFPVLVPVLGRRPSKPAHGRSACSRRASAPAPSPGRCHRGPRRASWKALLLGVAGSACRCWPSRPSHRRHLAGAPLRRGGCFTLWTANSHSLLQLSAPDRLRGPSSAYLFAVAGSPRSVGSSRFALGGRRHPARLPRRRQPGLVIVPSVGICGGVRPDSDDCSSPA